MFYIILKINEDYCPVIPGYDGKDILILETKYFKFKWFTDFQEWYIRLVIGPYWWRISRVSYDHGRH